MKYREWIERYKYYLFLLLVLFVLGLISALFFYTRQSSVEEYEDLSTEKNSQERQTQKMSDEKLLLYADVKGAVKQPGIYQIHEDMRVWDVVQLAGGVQENAETKNVNFAEKVSDQMVIYIPSEDEVVQTYDKEEIKQESQQSDKVNLNQANESELQTLTGIGQKKAQEIILYREENGGFREIEELKKIPGIGEKTFEKLREAICIE